MIFMQDFLDKLKSAVDPLVLLGLRRLRCLSFRMGGETQVGCGISGTMTQHHIVEEKGFSISMNFEFEDGQNHNNYAYNTKTFTVSPPKKCPATVSLAA